MFLELAAVPFRLLTRLLHSVPLIMWRQQAQQSWSWQKGPENKKREAKGGGKKRKERKEKKALKKTELAKLYFKVGWHIRGTSSYSSAFLRDIYARTAAFCLKPEQRPNIHRARHAPRPNYPLDHKQ